MTISTINRIKTVANKLNTQDASIITIYENNGLTIGNELIIDHKIVSFNCFIKNLRAFALIKSLAEISLPNFTLDDSETDKLYKTLNTEWGSARKQLTVYISNQVDTDVNGYGWFKVGSLSLLNPSGYPYRVYNLMDLFTDNLAIELGDNGKIGVQIEDVGYGLLDSMDEVTIHGSYIEEIFVQSPDPSYVTIVNSNTAPVEPVIEPSTPFPLATVFRVSASDIVLNDNDLVSLWQQPSASDIVVSQTMELNQPTFKTNVLNGKSAVYFYDYLDGNNKFLSITQASDASTPLSLVPVDSDWLIFLVAKFEGSYNVGFTNFSSGDPYNSFINIGGDFTNIGYYDTTNTFNVITAETYPYEWKIYVLFKTGNVFTLYINGDPYPLGNINGLLSYSRNFLDSALIGCKDSNSNYMSGYIADIGIINNPAIGNINTIGQYFKTLYNLTWTDI